MTDFERLVQQKLEKRHKEDPMFEKVWQLTSKAFEWQREGGKKAVEANLKEMVAEVIGPAEQQLKDLRKILGEA